MMENWLKYKLNDLSEKIIDCEHKTAPTQDEGFPSIRTPNIGKGRLLLDDVRKVSNETYKMFTKRAIPKYPDLILAREAPLGNIAIIPKGLDVCLGQRTVLISPDESKVDPRFLCYRILSQEVQHTMHSRGGGSTVPHLNIKEIRKLPISIPPLRTQRKIASILSAYDDLIENNLKRIKLLEEKAQLTYEEWFVRMKFPGHETTPINTETGLPEGWINVKLTDHINLLRGIEPGSKNYKESINDGLIPFIRVGDLSKRSSNIFISKNIVKNKIAKRTDVLLSLDGSPGQVVYGLEGAYSTGVRKAIPKTNNIKNSFVFALLSSDKIQGLIRNHSTGSTILHAGGSVKFMRFDMPTQNILTKFYDISEDIFFSVLSLNKQNQLLKEARDILLPRLMTGMIDVDKMNLKTPQPATA